MKKLYTSFFLSIAMISFRAAAETITSTASGGNYRTAATWVGGAVPGAADAVVIAAGATVTLNNTSNGVAITTGSITVNGLLKFGSTLAPSLVVNGNLSIASGGTFTALYTGTTGRPVTVNGNFTNNGTIDFSYSGSALTMGQSANATTLTTNTALANNNIFSSIYFDNSNGVNIGSAISISNRIRLINGPVTSGANITLNKSATGNGPTVSQSVIERTQAGSIDNYPVIATATPINVTYYKNPLVSDAVIDEGFELPVSRDFYVLTIDNPGGVNFTDDLSLRSSSGAVLNFNQGIVTMPANKTIKITNSTVVASNINAGTATSYLQGGGIAVSAGSTTALTRNIPLGDGSGIRRVIVNGLKSTSGTTVIRFALESPGQGTGENGLTLSNTRRWVSSLVSGTSVTYTGLTVDYGTDDMINGLTAPNLLSYSESASGTFMSLGSGGSTTTTVTAPAGNKLGYFALGYSTTLPIELSYFNAKAENNRVRISWLTSSELNNDRFIVERSINGADFMAIATLKGKASSQSELTYAVYDNNPLQGTNYYRLVQVDLNGKETVYDPQSVKFLLAGIAISIYPNPATDKIIIGSYPAKQATITLRDVTGKTARSLKADIENGYQLDLTDITLKGIYFLTINGTGFTRTSKIIIN